MINKRLITCFTSIKVNSVTWSHNHILIFDDPSFHEMFPFVPFLQKLSPSRQRGKVSILNPALQTAPVLLLNILPPALSAQNYVRAVAVQNICLVIAHQTRYFLIPLDISVTRRLHIMLRKLPMVRSVSRISCAILHVHHHDVYRQFLPTKTVIGHYSADDNICKEEKS